MREFEIKSASSSSVTTAQDQTPVHKTSDPLSALRDLNDKPTQVDDDHQGSERERRSTELKACIKEGRCEPKSGTRWMSIPVGSMTLKSGVRESMIVVKPFSIAQSEVTVTQYRACVKAGVCTEPMSHKSDDRAQLCHWEREGREDYPVNCVDWGQALTYSCWVGRDLPTSAQ